MYIYYYAGKPKARRTKTSTVSSAKRMRHIELKGGEKRMRRAIITVKGKLQKVRYRSKVKGIADGLGIVGEVGNLEDGSVRIYAES